MDPNLPTFYWAVLGVGLLAAAALDLRARRVPNWLTVGLFVTGLAARGLSMGVGAAIWGLAGGALCLGVALYPFARGWLGGGDAKLLAASGGWLGPLWGLEAAAAATVFGGIMAAAILLRVPRAVRREVALNLRMAPITRYVPPTSARSSGHSVPFALAILVGVAGVAAAHLHVLPA